MLKVLLLDDSVVSTLFYLKFCKKSQYLLKFEPIFVLYNINYNNENNFLENRYR